MNQQPQDPPAMRARGLSQVRRLSNWTAAALIAGTTVTTGYFVWASHPAAGGAGVTVAAGVPAGNGGGPAPAMRLGTGRYLGWFGCHEADRGPVMRNGPQRPRRDHHGTDTRRRGFLMAGWVRIGADGVAIAERAALGTTARVATWPPEDLELALAAVDTELDRLDRQASRFRDDSELSRVHHEPSPVHQLSHGLAEAIGVALSAARWTGGLVDPTVGGALIALGYDRDFAAIARAPAPAAAPAPAGGPALADGPGPAPGWRSVTLEGTVLSLPAGVRLDLGATAKGLGSDRAAAAAYQAGGRGGILVSLGGDIAVTGQPPAAAGRWPWPTPPGPARRTMWSG